MDLQRSALWPSPLTPEDRWALLDAIYLDPRTYYYPGWTALHDWLRQGLGWGLRTDPDALVAALVAVPETDTRAWLRLFVARGEVPTGLAWRLLWRAAAPALAQQGVHEVAGVGGRAWVNRFFAARGFRRQTDLQVLMWRGPTPVPPEPHPPAAVTIETMRPADLPAVVAVDRAAFPPVWRLRPELVHQACRQARLALVARPHNADALAGYALFTEAPHGAHLARLAVHPRWQRQGLGRALVRAGLHRLAAQDPRVWVSVNTEAQNQAAVRLYTGLGFTFQGEEVPVWVGRLPGMTAALAAQTALASG